MGDALPFQIDKGRIQFNASNIHGASIRAPGSVLGTIMNAKMRNDNGAEGCGKEKKRKEEVEKGIELSIYIKGV